MAEINAAVFLGDRGNVESAKEWMTSWFRAYPLYQYFVIELDGTLAGYAGWQVHGGFLRPEPVIELEQIGIDREFQGRGLAPKLIDVSKDEMATWIKSRNDRIESHITAVVWVYALNFNAMKIYAETFTEGVMGTRTQYGSRAENMLRLRIPMIRPVRERET